MDFRDEQNDQPGKEVKDGVRRLRLVPGSAVPIASTRVEFQQPVISAVFMHQTASATVNEAPACRGRHDFR